MNINVSKNSQQERILHYCLINFWTFRVFRVPKPINVFLMNQFMNSNVSKRVRWEISHPQWLKSVYPKCAFWHTLDIRWKGKISLGGWFFAEIVYICNPKGACGEIGRRARLRIWCRETCRFESYQAHPELLTVPPQLGVFVWFCLPLRILESLSDVWCGCGVV